MQSLIELLRGRRSIRQFTEKPVSQEDLDTILECVLRAPSSRGLNPWDFVVIDNKELLAEIAACKPHGAAFVKSAPLAVVVCGDPERCDVWIEDCSIAALLLHLAATDLGLGSCWVQVRLRENDQVGTAEQFIKEKLNIPETLRVEAIVAIGHAKDEKQGHAKETLLYERIGYNGYQKKR